jgi:NAD(P)-dependent dehydrogenase (short-subunit alcohol dehydrogenase family)
MSSVLITGSASGIGRATALELAGRGHRVIATARDPRRLEQLPVDTRLKLDVTDGRSVEQAIEAAGDIDVLVSNAGAIFIARSRPHHPTSSSACCVPTRSARFASPRPCCPPCANAAGAGSCSSPASWDA